jgi:hypothetical protein
MGLFSAVVVGMLYAHGPAPASSHADDVALAAPAPAGDATYGVQRTSRSQIPLWRDSGCIDLAVDSSSVGKDAAAVIDQAFLAWTDVTRTCGAVSFATHPEPHVTAAHDGIDTIVMRTDRWCRPATIGEPEQCYPPDVAAMTRLVFIDDPSDEDDGKILEVDMELNAVNFELLLPGQTPATTKSPLDLQAVVTHEAGHVLGLAHNCGLDPNAWPTDHAGRRVPACDALPSTSNVLAATMYYTIAPGDIRARTPKSGDVQGACTIARGLECGREVEGGCAAGGPSSSIWAVLLVTACTCSRRSHLRRSRAATLRES